MINYIKNGAKNSSIHDFECLRCGECCRAGYDVYIKREDVENWKKLEKKELLENIIINSACISINNKTECNSEEGISIKRIKKKYNNFSKKLEELRRFIQNNHEYRGKNCLRQYIKTILLDLAYDPLLAPKSFNTILKGLEFGLEYILKTDASGKCPFLNLNLCLIHDFKPIACKNFPYARYKQLRNDKSFLTKCRGFKNIY
jgi:Fe-S-cluster containining protein